MLKDLGLLALKMKESSKITEMTSSTFQHLLSSLKLPVYLLQLFSAVLAKQRDSTDQDTGLQIFLRSPVVGN